MLVFREKEKKNIGGRSREHKKGAVGNERERERERLRE